MNDEDVERLEKQIDSLNDRMAELEDVERLEKQVDSLNDRVSELEDKLKDISEALQDIFKPGIFII